MKSKIGMVICKKQKQLEEQELENNNHKTFQSSPESTSTSTLDTETCTPQPSKTHVDWYGNPISVTSEEGQKEDTSEDCIDEIDCEVHIRNSVYDL